MFLNVRLPGKFQSTLSCSLYIGLVIATNAISNRHKVEVVWIKDIVVLLCHLQQSFCQPIVVLFLFGRVILGRMLQIVISIGNQKALQLRIMLPRELAPEDSLFFQVRLLHVRVRRHSIWVTLPVRWRWSIVSHVARWVGLSRRRPRHGMRGTVTWTRRRSVAASSGRWWTIEATVWVRAGFVRSIAVNRIKGVAFHHSRMRARRRQLAFAVPTRRHASMMMRRRIRSVPGSISTRWRSTVVMGRRPMRAVLPIRWIIRRHRSHSLGSFGCTGSWRSRNLGK
mmetsp:Transcript_12952/g.28394  ORF Transcript_12952/g.28394 Transcript_12952/m.28394 type:complete len:282 (-) Transcript_12952:1205-2050(-)